MAVEFPVMEDLTLLAAKDVLTLAPDCYRAHDAMCGAGGVSTLHQATMAGPEVLTRTLAEELLAVETLPAAVKTQLESAEASEPAICKSLGQAGKTVAEAGEPSWAVLGRLIGETRFVHVARRLYFLGSTWACHQIILGHVVVVGRRPHLPGLPQTIAWNPPKATQSLVELIEHLDLANVELSALPMITSIFNSNRARRRLPWTFALKHTDTTAHYLLPARRVFHRAVEGQAGP